MDSRESFNNSNGLIEVTQENYFSPEVRKDYLSYHDYLEFHGSMIDAGCEARAMAKLRGEWTEEITTPLLVGSYVDSYFEGTLDRFKKEHPECFATFLDYAMPLDEMRKQYGFMFTRTGKLKAEWTKTKIQEHYPHLLKEVLTLKTIYQQANVMIERCLKDELFMEAMSGEKQKIITFYWAGVYWRAKLDSYIKGKAIVDLKSTSGMHKAWRIRDYGYVSFVEAFSYPGQLALYQKGIEILTGEKLPCYIAAVSKEEYPEIALINIDQMTLDHALNEIETNLPSVLAVRNGELEPIRCERCDYCKSTKVLTAPISMDELIME